jgi:hypothetical protein
LGQPIEAGGTFLLLNDPQSINSTLKHTAYFSVFAHFAKSQVDTQDAQNAFAMLPFTFQIAETSACKVGRNIITQGIRDMTSDEIFRRAGGRRRYQALRRHEALLRRAEIIEHLNVLGFQRGTQAKIARLTGWSEATISRDFAAIRKRFGACPACGRVGQRIISEQDRLKPF